MSRVVIHWDANGSIEFYAEPGAVVYCIDERCPSDRVYKLTSDTEAAVVDGLLADSPVGHSCDEYHPQATAKIHHAQFGLRPVGDE